MSVYQNYGRMVRRVMNQYRVLAGEAHRRYEEAERLEQEAVDLYAGGAPAHKQEGLESARRAVVERWCAEVLAERAQKLNEKRPKGFGKHYDASMPPGWQHPRRSIHKHTPPFRDGYPGDDWQYYQEWPFSWPSQHREEGIR